METLSYSKISISTTNPHGVTMQIIVTDDPCFKGKGVRSGKGEI